MKKELPFQIVLSYSKFASISKMCFTSNSSIGAGKTDFMFPNIFSDPVAWNLVFFLKSSDFNLLVDLKREWWKKWWGDFEQTTLGNRWISLFLMICGHFIFDEFSLKLYPSKYQLKLFFKLYKVQPYKSYNGLRNPYSKLFVVHIFLNYL